MSIGLKFYCCDVPAEKNIDCSWKDKCSGDDVIMTFDGTFLETVDDILGTFGGLVGSALADVLNSFDRKLGHDFCCSPEEAKKWKNCEWHGQPGSCFDNHCETGHQVQLAESSYGECQSCAPRLERTRAFCCDPADEKSPFLPVPLEYLFPKPPDSATANTDFTLKVDPTWGTGSNKDQNEPNVSPVRSLGCAPLIDSERLLWVRGTHFARRASDNTRQERWLALGALRLRRRWKRGPSDHSYGVYRLVYEQQL